MERHRSAIEQKERVADEIRKNIELAKEETVRANLRNSAQFLAQFSDALPSPPQANSLAERVQIEFEMKGVQSDAKREQDTLNRRQKDYSISLKNLKRAEQQLVNTQSLVPFMKRQIEDASRQVVVLKEEGKRQVAAAEEVRREVDVFINNFLKQEGLEAEKAEWVRAVVDEVKSLEEEVVEVAKEERDQRKIVAQLNEEREIEARKAAKAMHGAKAVNEELKVKELIIMDLSKRDAETRAKLREFSKLYDIVKTDRNKYVNQIQSSTQALAEMKEKTKILMNEVEILRNESLQKDMALQKERLGHGNSFYARDQLRVEQNRNITLEKESKGKVDQLVAEIDNLNALINGVEQEMLRLKKRYEVAVEERNYTGIQLIDRNDELCILYEKANMQQTVLKKGELTIREREEEIRLLDLQVAELVRDVEVTRRKLPKIPAAEQEIVTLQAELEEERLLAERLSAELEAPENSKRWRKLEGKDPEPEDLAAKLQVLEERVNDRKEQLLEKDLVLEEVSNLANRLRTQALEGREDTLELAKRVNDFQTRIKVTTRRMMATVSELSMYQATAMKLTQENQAKQAEAAQAEANLSQGLPPSEEIEREWMRYEADLARRAADAAERNVLAETAPAQLTQTTAEPRPNAYIPDDIGIPKPYGALQPFKPTEQGTSMRHIRKPQPREIEL